MATEMVYKGKTLEELQSLSVADFSKLTNSRARRSIKRGLKIQEKI